MFERQAAIKTKHVGLRLILKVNVTFFHNVPLGHTFSKGANIATKGVKIGSWKSEKTSDSTHELRIYI